jgi:hypothetical protein
MIKQISITLATIASFAAFAGEINRIQQIEAQLAHIAQQKKSIIQDLEHTMFIAEKVNTVTMTFFKDQYKPLTEKIVTIIAKILSSKEFTETVDKATNFAVECIVNKSMHLENIDFQVPQNPLDELVTKRLEKAFPAINPHVEQLFNLFYITNAAKAGSELLLAKLTFIEDVLITELEILNANVITE